MGQGNQGGACAPRLGLWIPGGPIPDLKIVLLTGVRPGHEGHRQVR